MEHPTQRFGPSSEDATPEHATQRLPPAPEPAARLCIRCHTPMIVVRRNGRPNDISLSLGTYELSGVGVPVNEILCRPWVCPDCGYMELVATDLPGLLEQ